MGDIIMGGTEFSATFHLVDSLGNHNGMYIHGLPQPDLDQALAAAEQKGILTPQTGSDAQLAWVDFPGCHRDRTWFETQLRTTHIAVQEGARTSDHFMSAGVLASSIFHAKLRREPTWGRFMPHAHEKTMENFDPVQQYKTAIRFVRGWLPGFVQRDRPHPPNAPARTDSIRMLAAIVNSEEFGFVRNYLAKDF